MAADEERNRKIAIALGYYIWTNRPTGRLFIITGRDEDMECDLIEMLDEIDFSKPEWQIRIQEKVRELWCTELQHIEITDCLYMTAVDLMRGDKIVWFFNSDGPTEGDYRPATTRERSTAMEKALLWLHERKVKNG